MESGHHAAQDSLLCRTWREPYPSQFSTEDANVQSRCPSEICDQIVYRDGTEKRNARRSACQTLQ